MPSPKTIISEPKIPIEGFSSIYSICFCNRSGTEMSSQSIRAIYFPSAISNPLFSVTQIPLFFSLIIYRILLSSYERIISSLLSVEPSLIIISSRLVCVCDSILSIASFKYKAPLYTGIITLTRMLL